MEYRYSASTNSFYPESLIDTYISFGALPDDAKPCSATEYAEYATSEPPIGKERGADVNGRPSWVDFKPQTLEQLSEIERIWRNEELTRADVEINKIEDGVSSESITAWRSYRISLRDWPASEYFPDSSKRPVAP